MADAFALASAAAERRKATRKSALPPESGRAAQSAPVSAGGDGWHAPFGASPPSFWRGRVYLVHGGRQDSGAEALRERFRLSAPRAGEEGISLRGAG